MATRTLVTGATGFLGRNLTRELLARGGEVAILHRDSSRSSELADELSAAGATVLRYAGASELRDHVIGFAPDRVFHLATLYSRHHSSRDIEQMIDANVATSTHLFDALVGSDCTVVATQTFFQYVGGVPQPYSLYSATKEASSVIAEYYRKVAGLDVREAILYDTFGPGDTRDKLLPHLLDSFATGSAMALGPRAQPINLLYVDDVANGLIAAAAPGGAARICLRSAFETTVGEVVEVIRAISGSAVEVSFDDSRSINELVRNSGTWPSPTGWSAVVPLSDGVRSAWEWQTKQRDPLR